MIKESSLENMRKKERKLWMITSKNNTLKRWITKGKKKNVITLVMMKMEIGENVMNDKLDDEKINKDLGDDKETTAKKMQEKKKESYA